MFGKCYKNNGEICSAFFLLKCGHGVCLRRMNVKTAKRVWLKSNVSSCCESYFTLGFIIKA